jgi:hypothetical protein
LQTKTKQKQKHQQSTTTITKISDPQCRKPITRPLTKSPRSSDKPSKQILFCIANNNKKKINKQKI